MIIAVGLEACNIGRDQIVRYLKGKRGKVAWRRTYLKNMNWVQIMSRDDPIPISKWRRTSIFANCANNVR